MAKVLSINAMHLFYTELKYYFPRYVAPVTLAPINALPPKNIKHTRVGPRNPSSKITAAHKVHQNRIIKRDDGDKDESCINNLREFEPQEA